MRTRNRIKENRSKVKKTKPIPTIERDFLDTDYRKVCKLLGIPEEVSDNGTNEDLNEHPQTLQKKAVSSNDDTSNDESPINRYQRNSASQSGHCKNLKNSLNRVNCDSGEKRITSNAGLQNFHQSHNSKENALAGQFLGRKRDTKLLEKAQEGLGLFLTFIKSVHSAQNSKIIFEDTQNFQEPSNKRHCSSVCNQHENPQMCHQNGCIQHSCDRNSCYGKSQEVVNSKCTSHQRLQNVPKQACNDKNIAYAKQLSQEYLKSRLGSDDTNESVSLVQTYQPPEALVCKGYELVTNQSIHVRCAYYISWIKKAMFYQQLERQMAEKNLK